MIFYKFEDKKYLLLTGNNGFIHHFYIMLNKIKAG